MSTQPFKAVAEVDSKPAQPLLVTTAWNQVSSWRMFWETSGPYKPSLNCLVGHKESIVNHIFFFLTLLSLKAYIYVVCFLIFPRKKCLRGQNNVSKWLLSLKLSRVLHVDNFSQEGFSGRGILTYSGICLPKDNSEVMAHISDTEY